MTSSIEKELKKDHKKIQDLSNEIEKILGGKSEANKEVLFSQLREELTLDFLENGDDWGIEDPLKYRYIVDKICSFLEGFLTRTIDNKERDSYSASMVSKEVIGNEFLKKKGMLAFLQISKIL
jgi:hypothetical protein